MKKFLSIFLAAVLSLSCISVSAAEDAAAAESDYRADAVFQLKLMEADVSGDRRLDEEVSRLEFAISLYRALNYENMDQQLPAAVSIYSDVDELHYGAGYLEYLTNAGVVTGYPDGTFLSGKGISLDEAYIMLVKCAGCFRYQDAEISTIRSFADRIGLTEKIKVENSSALTRKNMAHLLYNLLFADYSEISGVDGSMIVSESKGEFLDVVMGLDYEDGVIYQYDGVSLYDEIADVDELAINKLVLGNASESETDWLGRRARVIYTQDTEEAVAVFAPKDNDVLVIQSKQLKAYSGNAYSYYKEGNTTSAKKAKIAKNADVLYNDYVCFDESKMMPQYGRVVLIDNNGDSSYDVVRIYEYESYILESVSAGGTSIVLTFKNDSEDGGHVVLDTGDYDKVRVNSVWNNIEKSLSKLKADTVVTVCRASTKMLNISTSTEMVEAEDVKKDEDDYGKTTLALSDGTIYGLTPQVYVKGWDLVGSADVIIYLDVNGYVAAVIGVDTGAEWKYGYVLKCKYDGEEERIILKLLTQDNEIKKFMISEKVTVDGTRYKKMSVACDEILSAYEQFKNADTSGNERLSTRLIRYCEKDGTISKLDTPIKQSLYETQTPAGYGDDNKLMLRAKGNLYSKIVGGIMRFKTIYSTDAEILGEVNLPSSDSRVFIIPTTSDGTENEQEDYSATTLGKATIKKEKWYPASGYNLDPESLECDILVIRNDIGVDADERVAVVNQVVQVLNEDDELCYGITTYLNGKKEETFRIMNSSPVSGIKLKKGDVIKCQPAGEEIYVSELLYRPGGGNGTLNTAPIPDSGNLNSEVVVCTAVTRKSDAWLQVAAPRDFPVLISMPSRVVIYDAQEKTTTVGNSGDIKTVESYGNNADVFIYYVDEYSVVDACVIRGE